MATIAFPLACRSGQLVLASGADQVRTHIRMVLQTEAGERVMRPRFGCLPELFDSLSNNQPAQAIADQLAEQVPEAVCQVQADFADSGALSITVTWQLAGEVQEPIVLEAI